MGYTIYWKWKGGKKPKEWFICIQRKVEMKYRETLCEMMIDDGESLFDVCSGWGPFPFERKEEYFHEDFVGKMLNESEFQFCKTARKLYDSAVKEALIEAQKLSDNAWEVTCDDGGVYLKDTILELGKDGTWVPRSGES